MKKFARKRDWLDQFKDYRMAAICSLQWINDRMKSLITNTCFISKVFYRCLMNTDCNVVLTWIILIWHTCKPQTLHVYPLPRTSTHRMLPFDHAFWRMYPLPRPYNTITQFDALFAGDLSGPQNASNLDTFIQICWWHQN